jgi:hypothetical protein
VRVELAIRTPGVRGLREDHARAGAHQKFDGSKGRALISNGGGVGSDPIHSADVVKLRGSDPTGKRAEIEDPFESHTVFWRRVGTDARREAEAIDDGTPNRGVRHDGGHPEELAAGPALQHGSARVLMGPNDTVPEVDR